MKLIEIFKKINLNCIIIKKILKNKKLITYSENKKN